MSLRHNPLPKTIDQVVESVRGCAADPDRWPETIGMIAEVSHSRCCALSTVDLKTGTDRLVYQVGFKDRYLELHRDKYGKLCPYNCLVRKAPTGTIVRGAEVMNDPRFWESDYYQNWLRPQKLIDWMGFKALNDGRRLIKLAVLRHEAQGRFGKVATELLSRLAPHVCRVLETSNGPVAKSITELAFEQALDALAACVLLVDPERRVLFMNRTAQDQLMAGDALIMKDGLLVLADKATEAAFAEAVTNTVSGKAPVTSIAIPSTNGGLVATVLPFSNGARKGTDLVDAAAIIFVQSALQESHLPSEAFAQLYQLTPSELRVLQSLAHAHDIKDTAANLGICDATVKTHLQHLYAKTGTSKQKDLIALFAHSVLRLDLGPQ